MLGTGNAAVTQCYNTCFALRHPNKTLLVDAGGGNGILIQLEKAGIPLTDIHAMFITHAHTDHILGAVWVVRVVAQLMQLENMKVRSTYMDTTKPYKYSTGFAHDTSCQNCSSAGKWHRTTYRRQRNVFRSRRLHPAVLRHSLNQRKTIWFQYNTSRWEKLVCLGDEPYNELNHDYVMGADWLLCEAFCLYDDRERFKPYEKHHSTALDAGRLASKLDVKNLLLYHTEDKTLATRKERYTAEAQQEFTGCVYVPDDLEKIIL